MRIVGPGFLHRNAVKKSLISVIELSRGVFSADAAVEKFPAKLRRGSVDEIRESIGRST